MTILEFNSQKPSFKLGKFVRTYKCINFFCIGYFWTQSRNNISNENGCVNVLTNYKIEWVIEQLKYIGVLLGIAETIKRYKLCTKKYTLKKVALINFGVNFLEPLNTTCYLFSR